MMKDLLFILCLTCVTLFTACSDSNDELIENLPAEPEQPEEPIPTDDDGFVDIMFQITSATATGLINGVETDNFWYQNQKIDLSFDGKPGTHFNSKGHGYMPVTLTYYFADEQPECIDYFIYYPRQDKSKNGNWGRFEMQYQNEAGEFIHVGDFDFQEKDTYTKQALEQPIENPKAVRFIIKSGYYDQVSCAEIKFYKQAQGLATGLFTDTTCSELKPDVTKEQIQALPEGKSALLKQIALGLYDKTYDMKRIQMYQAYPEMEKNTNKLGAYNRFENPTGIYFKTGDQALVFVGETQQALTMKVVDWSKEGNEKTSNYPLTLGTNTFTISQDGLAYIENWTKDASVTVPDVKIHIATGQVNGWFDYERGDDTAEWHQLLNNEQSECGILDIRGKFIQLAVDKPTLIKKCPDRGREMIEKYDEIVRIEQEMMGMYKHDWRPVNRMFGRRSYGGNPNANSRGISLPDMPLNPDNIGANSWVIAHELGHINQIRPNMKWHGTTEITNNLYSIWVQYQFTPHKLRLEHENISNGLGSPKLIGGRYSSYLLSGIIGEQPWMFQKGQYSSDLANGDVFVSLIPLWQLQLYAKVAQMGPEDFYPDLLTKAWKDANLSGPGKIQLNFMKNACDIMQQDLTEFFEKVGMLKEIDQPVNDYGNTSKLTISAEDVVAMKSHGAQYPKPATPVLYYISGNSVEMFRDKLTVTGTLNKGVTNSIINDKENKNFRTVSIDVWKNAVVYETYAGDKLTKAAICGTGFGYGGSTIVSYPQGSTCIKAVAWDGTRTLVYNIPHE
jgi:hypothetical protein